MSNEPVFVDASAYLALFLDSDSQHKTAQKLFEKIGERPLVTSQAVLGEILTVGSQRQSRSQVITFVNSLQENVSELVFESASLVSRSYTIFTAVKNKNISWVDCYSVAIMLELGMSDILTLDRDFKKISHHFPSINVIQ